MLGLYDKNEPFILGAYAVTFVALAALVLWAWLTARSAKRKLDALEGRARRARTESGE